MSRRKNKTPEQLLKQGLRLVQRQIEALETLQNAGGGLLDTKASGQLVALVELARKATADLNDPRKLLQKLTEAELERIARGTEPIPSKT